MSAVAYPTDDQHIANVWLGQAVDWLGRQFPVE